MKKILLITFSTITLFTNSFSQSIILSENFNTSKGLPDFHRSLGHVSFDDFSIIQNDSDIASINKYGKPFSVYPSPSNGPIQINFDEPVKQVKFSIYNMIGNEIKNVVMEKINDQQFKFNFGNQQPGFYFIRIQTGKYTYTTRITITAAVTQKVTPANV
ncbi:MAG: T9SS type A sorting domain-containing protein [Chitinophagales bacterium]